MIPFSSLSRQVLLYFVLFANLALAVPQNVTVDDAVLTGDVVPQYLPSVSRWNVNQNNNCTTCLVRLDPSQTFDGTWHDTTYHPSAGFEQAIQFTFTGNGLYIFFILANNVTGADTLTNVEFVLDQVSVGTFTHVPSSSTDFQYNVTVYANNSLDFGQHTMVIRPSTTSSNNVLMLFDYLVYTTDPDLIVPSASPTSSSTDIPSATQSPSPTSSGGTNIGAIVGGTVGGIAALVIAVASLLCYRRRRRRNNVPEIGPAADPFVLSSEVDTTPHTYPTTSVGLSVSDPTASSTIISSTIPPTLKPPPSTIGSSSSGVVSPRNNSALLEQVELLRDEVAGLRRQQASSQVILQTELEPPPEYS